MGRPFIQFYCEESNILVYCCAQCFVHVAASSKPPNPFDSQTGETLEFEDVVNLFEIETSELSEVYNRQSILDIGVVFRTKDTGWTTYLHCVNCKLHIGWKYKASKTEMNYLLEHRITSE